MPRKSSLTTSLITSNELPCWQKGLEKPDVNNQIHPRWQNRERRYSAPPPQTTAPLLPVLTSATQVDASMATKMSESKKLAELGAAFNEIWRRGRNPWDADRWLQLRELFVDNGAWDMVGGLVGLADRATNEVIESGKYYLPQGGEVKLVDTFSANPITQWFGSQNVTRPGALGGDPPPLIVTTQTPLEVAGYLKKHSAASHVCIAIEVTDYKGNGEKLCGMEARNPTQQELFARTDFKRFAEHAAKQASIGKSTMKGHLTAATDPYVFAASDVTMFRSSAEEGYAFVKDPMQCDIVVSARLSERPKLRRCKKNIPVKRGQVPPDMLDSRGEPIDVFADDEDFFSLQERLNLMGLAALNVSDHNKEQQPILVLSATNLRLQPRHSIAKALKEWRSKYASCFEGIVVACGNDRNTAELFDEEVNDLFQDRHIDWHWNPTLLKLSVNPNLIELGAELSARHARSHRRRSSQTRRPSSNSTSDAPGTAHALRKLSTSENFAVSAFQGCPQEQSEKKSMSPVDWTSQPILTVTQSKDDGDLLSRMKPGPTDSTTSTRVNTVNTCERVQSHDLGRNSPDSWEAKSESSFESVGEKEVPSAKVEELHTSESKQDSKDQCQRALFNEVRSLALSVHSELDKNRNSTEGKQRRKSAQVEQQRRLSHHDVHVHDAVDILSPALRSPSRRRSV